MPKSTHESPMTSGESKEPEPGRTADDRGHCFCMVGKIQLDGGSLYDRVCCWCGASQCFNTRRDRVPGHGPHRTQLVLDTPMSQLNAPLTSQCVVD